MTVAAGDAHEFPIYAGRYRVYFPLLDADGDLVTGASTPDSERSIDGATFADCSNEMTEVATSSGVYFLDLIATEMTSKCTVVIAKSATAGMKTTVLTLYPKRMPIIRSGTAQAGAASTITLDSGASAKDGAYVGMYIQCSNNTPSNVQGQTRKIVSYVGSTKVATVEAAWGTNPSSSTTFDVLCPETVNVNVWLGKEVADTDTNGYPKITVKAGTGTGEINLTSGVADANVTKFGGTNGTFASGRAEVNTTHIAGSAVSTSTAQIGVNVVQAAGTAWNSGAIGAATLAADTITAAKVADGTIDAATFAAGAITAAAIAADAIGASELAADAVAEIQSGLAPASDVTAIKAKTDQLTFGVANRVSANITHVNATAVTGDGHAGTEWGPA